MILLTVNLTSTELLASHNIKAMFQEMMPGKQTWSVLQGHGLHTCIYGTQFWFLADRLVFSSREQLGALRAIRFGSRRLQY